MPESIFDSKPEREIYQRLKSVWSTYVDAYSQFPIRKVLDYENLKGQELTGPLVRIFRLILASEDYIPEFRACRLHDLQTSKSGHSGV